MGVEAVPAECVSTSQDFVGSSIIKGLHRSPRGWDLKLSLVNKRMGDSYNPERNTQAPVGREHVVSIRCNSGCIRALQKPDPTGHIYGESQRWAKVGLQMFIRKKRQK